MAWTNYKPTKAERDAIQLAYHTVEVLCGYDSRVEYHAKQEAKGAGWTNDRIPLIAAKALMAQWFLQGVEKPDMRLADTYFCRVASIFAMGSGAARAKDIAAAEKAILRMGVAAHEEAFERMMARNKANLGKPE